VCCPEEILILEPVTRLWSDNRPDDSMVLLSADIVPCGRRSPSEGPNITATDMDCSSVAAALVPHHQPPSMKQRNEANSNAVPPAGTGNWHHKHEQMMLMDKQKAKGKSQLLFLQGRV